MAPVTNMVSTPQKCPYCQPLKRSESTQAMAHLMHELRGIDICEESNPAATLATRINRIKEEMRYTEAQAKADLAVQRVVKMQAEKEVSVAFGKRVEVAVSGQDKEEVVIEKENGGDKKKE